MGQVSRDGLHWILWDQRSKSNTVRVQQNRLCEDLLVSKFTLNRVLKAMCEEGRLRKLSPTGGADIKSFEVFNPETWQRRLGEGA